MNKAMRIILFFLMSLNMSAKEAVDLIPERLDEKSLAKFEAQMNKWATKVGNQDLVKISNMSQRPEEVEIIQFLFPHLLPNDYNGKSIYLNCFHLFKKFKEAKSKKELQDWENCIRYDFRVPEDYMIKTFERFNKSLKE